ncbi:MAG: hypothetical protein V1859_07030 [archaeon]
MASASDLERGKFFEYKNELFQVVRKELVNCGTHSHTKLKLACTDLKGKKDKTLTLGHNDQVDLVEIMKKTGNIISKSETGVQVMDPFTYETLDANCDKELLETLNEGDEVVFVEYKNAVTVISKKRA